jgi:hypothetical protein
MMLRDGWLATGGASRFPSREPRLGARRAGAVSFPHTTFF